MPRRRYGYSHVLDLVDGRLLGWASTNEWMGICVGLRLPVEEDVFVARLPREGTLEEADHVRLGEGILLDEGEYNRLLEVDFLELLHRTPFLKRTQVFSRLMYSLTWGNRPSLVVSGLRCFRI